MIGGTPDIGRPPVVSDRLYYCGPEKNAGLGFQVKFVNVASMAGFFNLNNIVGAINNREYSLRDILVDIDFDGGNANWADVRISGPKPIILSYLSSLEKNFREKVFSDFSWNFMNFKPTAYYEREEVKEPQKGDPLSLCLATDKQKNLHGEPMHLQATVKNDSRRNLTLAQAQDGSVHGFRYPMCVIEMKNEQGLKEGFAVVPGCKTVAPLASDAFFEIEPGKTVELFSARIALSDFFIIQKPGVY